MVKGLPMLWDEQKEKDMELYPLIAPIVNYTKNKFNSSHKVASDITNFARKGARRLLQGETETETEAITDTETTENAAEVTETTTTEEGATVDAEATT